MPRTASVSTDTTPLNLPSEFLEKLIDLVIGAVPTDSIYIFGSYARGEERSTSDLDIYVRFTDDEANVMEKCIETRMALFDFIRRQNDLSFDLVGDYNSAHINKASSIGTLANVIEREGVMIYG